MSKNDNSQYNLRKAIGFLGIALPILLLAIHRELLASMSHYYYTASGVFFIGILFAFALILFTYHGYDKDPLKKEILSDNLATNIAGICIFITVMIPTEPADALGTIWFEGDPKYLFGHESALLGTIHLASAGIFLFLLGYMSHSKFTLSPKITESKRAFYKWCGRITWISIAILVALIVVDDYVLDGKLNESFPAYVFWMELVGVWAFAIAWLVKGKLDRDLKNMTKRLTS